MFNSGILDVALGLVFVYLLLSLMCTALTEIIEARLKTRASDLERGIRELLNDPRGHGLARDLYQHPLVSGLFQGAYEKARERRVLGGTGLPSYIPRREFALALLDVVRGKTEAERALPMRDAIAQSPVLLANPEVRRALLTLLDDAGADLTKLRTGVEQWFDSSMDRVSGWYKRRTQWIVLWLGLLLACLANADTISIATSLSHDVGMRDALVAAAQEYAKPTNAPSQPGNAPAQTGPPAEPIPACARDVASPECRVGQNLREIERLGLPIGWVWGDGATAADPRAVPRTPERWLLKALGVILTALAVSLGSPFWFDVLNKIIVVRATVKPREKSPDEPAVDGSKEGQWVVMRPPEGAAQAAHGAGNGDGAKNGS
jgi:hypothetical protein